jgi:hypothetical protein
MNYAHAYPRFWFWYFWLCCVLLALGLADSAIDAVSGRGSVTSVFGLAMSTLAMWPLYGYVRQTRLNPRWLWRVALIFTGLALLLTTLLVLFVAAKTSTFWVLSVSGAILLVSAPQLFALYQYIHRSPHIWDDA